MSGALPGAGGGAALDPDGVLAAVVPDAPPYLAADFAEGAAQLLPRGPAWPRSPGSVLARLLGALAPTYERSSRRAAELLADTPAGRLQELLPEWEAALGLPDPCAGPDPTLAQRAAQVRARLAGRGGQSVPYFQAFAQRLGYAVTVQEFAPARADALCADDPAYGPDWAHAWQVTAAASAVAEFAADLSFADEPLAAWGERVLECELRRLAPAHGVLRFAYAGAAVAGLLDAFVLDRDALG